MARRHPILRGIGILSLWILIFFTAIFFYAYLTGGERRAVSLFSGEGIGVLQISGEIENSRTILDELKQFRDSKWIKAIVVRIDSPGGAVAPTQEIFEELGKIRTEKPLVASLGSMATSGGYYVASACDQIVANPGTLTGSIGVIMQLGNVEELMRKLGLRGYNIKSGPHKDIGSPYQPLSTEGRAILQGLVDDVHGQFVQAVSKARGMDEGEVRKLADGRVYSGRQAKDLGLVDVLGNLEDAIDLAAKRAGLEERPQVFYSRTEREPWWEKIFFSVFGGTLGESRSWGLRYEWSPSMLQ